MKTFKFSSFLCLYYFFHNFVALLKYIKMKDNISNLLKAFFENFKEVKDLNDIVYNEFSLQHELGIFLRERLKDTNFKVYFEKNISSFFEKKKRKEITKNFVKKEIDIIIVNNSQERYAIELKFPRNGQYPEQMYSFIKDIRFMEQVKSIIGFTKTFAVCLVDNRNFYEGNVSEDKIYKYFRNQPQPIERKIQKPTGKIKENDFICLDKQYQIQWLELNKKHRYYIVEI